MSELVGEIIARPARLAIGIWPYAQPELNGPISPITAVACAYSLALAAHLASSKIPACAVESSHDW